MNYVAALAVVFAVILAAPAWAAPLSVEDFSFEGPLGSQGATIEPIGENHFKVKLGHAPNHLDWNNKLQFTIRRNARGNSLRLDVVFEAGPAFSLNEYFHSWSYDGETWQPVPWQLGYKASPQSDTLVFPEFSEDVVYVGHQVPMSYERMVALVEKWRAHPCVQVTTLGKSLGGRDLFRVTITDPASPTPPAKRWAHYFTNQHPGEHNAQWRMAGMIDWLLSDEGQPFRQRAVCHFIPMTSPDAPSNGWYRVNAQGVDMNRSFFVDGPSEKDQAHEAFLCQKDLETLMQSDCPPASIWSMHTWSGLVDPRIMPGPEMGGRLGPWTELRDIIEKNDTTDLIRPMELWKAEKDSHTHWTEGPHKRYGVTSVLCEGGAVLYTKDQNIQSGVVLMKSISEYYR